MKVTAQHLEPDHKGGSAVKRGYEAFCKSLEKSSIEKIGENEKIGGYFKKGENLVSFITMLIVLAYTIVSCEQKDVAIGQLREMQGGSAQTEAAIKAAQASAKAATDQVDVLRYEQRAWIAPVGLNLNWVLEDGGPLRVGLIVQNTGKEPAIRVGYKLSEFVVNYIVAGPEEIAIDRANATCKELSIDRKSGFVVYPNQTAPLLYGFPDTAENRKVVESALERRKSIVVDGCISYQTVGTYHTSSFRFFLRDVPGPSCIHNASERITCSWRFNGWPQGNDAN